MGKVLYFWAPWCKACPALKPHIERAREMGLDVESINVEENTGAAYQYSVTQLPTLIFLVDGKVVGRKTGVSEKVILALREFARETTGTAAGSSL